jgi:hypothetical protein
MTATNRAFCFPCLLYSLSVANIFEIGIRRLNVSQQMNAGDTQTVDIAGKHRFPK